MKLRIAAIVSMLALSLAGKVDSAPEGSTLLGYERVGTIQSIDRSKGTIRIDGQDFLLPDDLSDRSHRVPDADAGVQYRAGDTVGYTISPDSKSSGPARLSVLWLLTS